MRVNPKFNLQEIIDKNLKIFPCGRCKGKGCIISRVDIGGDFCSYCNGSGIVWIDLDAKKLSN